MKSMADADTQILDMMSRAARAAAANAYSPYSGFRVGAALMDRNQNVFTGCNVENASLGLTQCAERNAVANAINAGAGPEDLVLMVVYKNGPKPIPPCGACRQVMHEMMAGDSRVISTCDSERIKSWSREEYLPDAFRFDDHRD